MSTRALYTFTDEQFGEHHEYHVYKHHDGYPTGALEAIENALANAWKLPRFEADEFAAAFISANKAHEGGIRLTIGETWDKAASGDCEYHWIISFDGKNLIVEAYEIGDVETATQSLLNKGTLKAMKAWANRKAAAG